MREQHHKQIRTTASKSVYVSRATQRKRVRARERVLLYFVINIAIITIIITQLLLLVFCQLAVFRHTLIMNLLFILIFYFGSLLSTHLHSIQKMRRRKKTHNDICVFPHRWMSSIGKTLDSK